MDIVFFDLETTGLELQHCRIVQLACSKVDGITLEVISKKNYYVNPGIPIPAEATAIHGINDDTVRDEPTFKQFSKGLLGYLEGCTIAGYNVRNYDVPVLSEEFNRCGIVWPLEGVLIFDAMDIFHKKEPRDLAGALRFYTGEVLSNAHNAARDVDATVDVFKAQLEKYDDMFILEPESIISVMDGGEKRLDIAGKIVLNEEGYAVYAFGKSKGKRVVHDPGFGEWMLRGDFPRNTKDVVAKLINL